MVPIAIVALFLIGSNVAFFLPSLKAYGRGMLVEGTIFLFMGIVSGLYHTSGVFGVDIIFSYATWQFDDFYLAFNIIPVSLLMIMFSTDKSLSDADRVKNFKVKSVAWFVLGVVAVTLVKQDVSTGIMVFVLGGLSVLAGTISIIFWRNNIHIDVIDFIVMCIFVIIGTSCYFLDEIYENDYWFLHSIWHVCCGIGIYFGVETENKTWNFIRWLTCGRYYYTEIEFHESQ